MGLLKTAAPQQAAPDIAQGVQRLVIAATKAIHTPQISSALLDSMHAAPDPATGIAKAAAMVAQGLRQKAGGNIPPELAGPALKKIVLLVAELAVSVKLFPVTKQVLVQAMQMLMQMKAQAGQQQGAQPAQPPQPTPQAPTQPMAQREVA